MFRVKKKEGTIVTAYRISEDTPMIAALIEEGKMKYLGDGKYEIFSREVLGKTGEVCCEGDYVKLDSGGFPYPNDRDFFLKNHKPVSGDEYEQIPKPLSAWDVKEPDCEEIRFLKENKGLLINEASEDTYFSAPLWGTTLQAAKDAVIVFYSIDRDDSGKITDISFNFVARPEFEKTYNLVDE